MNKKLRVGWFTFTCCEDSTIIFTELLNTHWQEWKKHLNFRHAKVLQSANMWDEIDVAFVEGAITSKDQEDKLKKIRSLAKKVVAIGSCACIGMPSSQRNFFNDQMKQEVASHLERFRYTPMVHKLTDIVPVDDQVNGCPMDENVFLRILEKYLRDFGVKE